MKQRKSGLIIPTSAQIHERTPRFGCMACGAKFYEDEMQKYERHVVSCSKAEEYSRAVSYYHRFPAAYQPYNEDFGDVAWQRYIDRMKEKRPEQVAKWFRTGDKH